MLALVEKEEIVPGVEEDGGMERKVSCPDFWELFESRCFKFFPTPSTWIDAEVEPDTPLHKMNMMIVY